jgi:hypothetical protein
MTLSGLALASAYAYGMVAVQVALPLGVTIPTAVCWILWWLLSLTLAIAVHATTPFFGTVELTVTVKVNTNLW